MSVLVEADFKVNEDSTSSSEDDSGVIESKEMIQLVKMETNIEKSLVKIASIRNKLENEDLHLNEETQFEVLLLKVTNAIKGLANGNINVSKDDLKALKIENKEIRKIFQDNKKIWQQEVKEEKLLRKQEKEFLKAQKQNNKVGKVVKGDKPGKAGKPGKSGKKKNKIVDIEKEKAKEEKAAAKMLKKLEKEKKKEQKRIFSLKLEKGRIEELPNDLNQIELWIDGWNISGCFGGRSRSKPKLINLLQSYYNGNSSNDDEKSSNGLTKNIELFYDGNGKNKLNGNINITHSGKNIIVDDLWVDILSKMNIIRKNNIICVTSDRELTVRLYNIGVTVIKSGTFFKRYLKPFLEGNDASKDCKSNDEGDFVMVDKENE